MSASAASEDVGVPTGSTSFVPPTESYLLQSWTAPDGVKVVKVDASASDIRFSTTVYVGVTAGKAYWFIGSVIYNISTRGRVADLHTIDPSNGSTSAYWIKYISGSPTESTGPFHTFKLSVTLSWSPEINKLTPTVTDY